MFRFAFGFEFGTKLNRGVGGGGSIATSPSLYLVVTEGDSITATDTPSSISYARRWGQQSGGTQSDPFFLNYWFMKAVSGSTLMEPESGGTGNSMEARKQSIKDIVGPGSQGLYDMVETILIGRNDELDNPWLVDLAAYCDEMRAWGYYIGLCTVLPSDQSGYNTKRNVVNDEIRLWTTGGSIVPGVHADFIIDFAADATMGPDAAASDTGLYYDGTHPTDAGHIVLQDVFTQALEDFTPTGFTEPVEFSVPPGPYVAGQTVSLSCTDPEAIIVYDVNNDPNNVAYMAYTGPIDVSSSMTIRAWAGAPGKKGSRVSVGAYTIGLQPPQLDLGAWYKQNTGQTVASGKVTAWADATTNNRHIVNMNVANPPAYSSDDGGVVQFVGNQGLGAQWSDSDGPKTYYMLVRQDAWGIANFVMDSGGSNAGIWQYSTSPGLGGYAGAVSMYDNVNPTIGDYMAVCLVLNGASSSIRINNNPKLTGDTGTHELLGGVSVGASSANSQGSTITVKEVLYYTGAHSDADQDAVIDYLLSL